VAVLPGFSARARAFLAQAYVALEQFDMAEKLCKDGLAREPEESDFEDMESFEEGRRNLQEVLDGIPQERNTKIAVEFMEQGAKLYQAGNPGAALLKLNEAIKLAPEIDILYFHRAHCHYALGSPEAVLADLKRFVASLASWPKDEQAEIQKDIDALKKKANKLLSDINQHGKEVTLLRQAANDALRDEKYEDAVRNLREALKKCPPQAQASLKPEIAAELMDCAMQAAAPAFDEECSFSGQITSICQQAVSWLEEAQRLHPLNTEITKILNIVRNRLEMVRDFGSPKVVKMYQQAVKAFESNNLEEACEIMRNALLASGGTRTLRLAGGSIVGGAQRLRDDLSKILVSLAIQSIHEPWKDPEAIRRAEEALELDPTSDDAQKVLRILRSKPG
jgi:tetratricopeptide (TPR) repeat protein